MKIKIEIEGIKTDRVINIPLSELEELLRQYGITNWRVFSISYNYRKEKIK